MTLISHWNCDEGAGSTLLDSVGPNNGTISAAVYDNDAPALSVPNPKSLLFAGGGGVDFGNDSSLQLDNGSLNIWIKTADAGLSYAALVVKQLAFGLFLKANVLQAFDWGASADLSTGINLADDHWHPVGMSWQSGITNGTVIYLHGLPVLVATMTVTSQANSLEMGEAAGGSQFDTGRLDEFSIYDSILTAAEFMELAIYQSQSAPSGINKSRIFTGY